MEPTEAPSTRAQHTGKEGCERRPARRGGLPGNRAIPKRRASWAAAITENPSPLSPSEQKLDLKFRATQRYPTETQVIGRKGEGHTP